METFFILHSPPLFIEYSEPSINAQQTLLVNAKRARNMGNTEKEGEKKLIHIRYT